MIGWNQRRALPAVLHIDTGMSRTGLDRLEARVLMEQPSRLDGINLRFIMSHMACADTPDDPMNRRQQQYFATCLKHLPKAAEGGMLAASSASFLGPDWHFDWIRPGVALYGVRPNRVAPNPLKPTISLDARILQIRQIDAPESVGYGASHRVQGPTRIAWTGDIEMPIVGRVSMDLFTVDITAAPQIGPGDSLNLIGPHQDVDAVADKAGTIGYEILTSLGQRYARHYLGQSDGETA